MRTLLLALAACTADAPKTGGDHATSDPTGSEPTTPTPSTDTDTDTGSLEPPPAPCQADTANLRGIEIDVFGDVVKFGSFDGSSGAFAPFTPLAPVDSAGSLLNAQEGFLDLDGGMLTVVANDADTGQSLLTVDAATGETLWQPELAINLMGLHYDPVTARAVGWGGGYEEGWSVGTVERETGAFVPLAAHPDVLSPYAGGLHALDPAGQRLFSIVGEAGNVFALYTIDLTTGDLIDRVELTGGYVDLSHFAYDEAVGQLFAIRRQGGEPRLVTVDPSTGDTQLVGAAAQEPVGGGNWRLFDPRTRLLWTSCEARPQSVCAVCTDDGGVPVTLQTERFPYFVYPL